MPHADYLTPTVIPGLVLRRGLREVLHLHSNLVILTLPEGLSRTQAVGSSKPRGLGTRLTGALLPLASLDWTGELSQAHQMALNVEGPHYATLERLETRMARAVRIQRAMREALRWLNHSAQGQAINRAFHDLRAAQTLRAGALTPAQKAAATRAEKAVRDDLLEIGVQAAQLRRLEVASTTSRLARQIEGHNRCFAQCRSLEEERAARSASGQHVALRFLAGFTLEAGERVPLAGRAADTLAHLRFTLIAETDAGDLVAAAGQHFGGWKPDHRLQRANRERVRLEQRQYDFDPRTNPEVRELTRVWRLACGRDRLSDRFKPYQPEYNPAATYIRDMARKLVKASQFRGQAVRSKHLAPLLRTLTADWGERSGVILRAILKEAEQYAEDYGYASVQASEVPPVSPRWGTARVMVPPRQAGGVTQPGLF